MNDNRFFMHMCKHSYLATWQEDDVSILILRSSNTGSGHVVVIHWPSFGRRKLNKNIVCCVGALQRKYKHTPSLSIQVFVSGKAFKISLTDHNLGQ
jgi:hypothetical protein